MNIPRAENNERIIDNSNTNSQQLSSDLLGARLLDWFKPSLSRYPGLHQVRSRFVPGGIHQL